MEPTDPPRPTAPSLLSGSPGKSDHAKDSGRILASLEKGPAIGDTGKARKAPAAPVLGRPKLLPLLGAGIAVGVLIWFLSGHIQPPGTAKAVAAVPANAAPAPAESPATATIVSTTPVQQPGNAGQTSTAVPAVAATPVPAASAAAVSRQQPEALASVEPAGQPQRSPLAVLADDDTDAAQKAKKGHVHKKADSDIRLIEALVSHVNGEEADDGLLPKKSKTRTARTAGNTDSAN